MKSAVQNTYSTSVEAINDLQLRGYTHEFILDDERECVVCHQHSVTLSPDDFKIDFYYRFDGQTNPDDETIIYAISSHKHNVKGLIINAFGVYADGRVNRLIEMLRINEKDLKKPIKRDAALVKFSQEHHFGLLLCWKINQGIKLNISVERIAAYILFFFENDLQKHFEEEEKTLFVALKTTDPLRIQAEQEHAVIYQLLNTIKLNKADYALLSQFSEILNKHIRFEERTFFNHIQEKLSKEELVKLERQHLHKACDIDINWNDHFWKNLSEKNK
ncbi:MAG: hemerythrin domain-containing protein [Bacteroidia bacterium]|nr:hemerythrin domain-containing protein [Bacteroidia bacterium]